MTTENPLDCDEIVIRGDGTVGFLMRADVFTARWCEDLLAPEATMDAVRKLLGYE